MSNEVDLYFKNLYVCSVDFLKKEVESDFKLLRRIRNENILYFLEIVKGLSEKDKLTLSIGLIKRFNDKGMRMCGDSVSETEQAFITRFESDFINTFVPIENSFKPNRNKYCKTIIGMASEVYKGCKVENVRGGNIRIVLSIGKFDLIVQVDIGSRINGLSYSHTLVSGSEKVVIDELCSVSRILGITGATTDWIFRNENESLEAIDTMFDCVDWYCKIIEKLSK